MFMGDMVGKIRDQRAITINPSTEATIKVPKMYRSNFFGTLKSDKKTYSNQRELNEERGCQILVRKYCGLCLPAYNVLCPSSATAMVMAEYIPTVAYW